MPSRSPSRGRSFTRSPRPAYSRSRSRSISHSRRKPASGSRSRSAAPRSLSRNGRSEYRQRSRSRGRSASQDGASTPIAMPRSSRIVVEKLTKNVQEAHLREVFGTFGDIHELDMPINRAFMTNKGTAYILYRTSLGAETALANMHDGQLDGTQISVSIVLPKQRFAISPAPRRPPPNRFGEPHRYRDSVAAAAAASSRPLPGGAYSGGYQGNDDRSRPYRNRSPPAPRYGSGRSERRNDGYRDRSYSPDYRRGGNSGVDSYGRYARSPSRSRSPPPRVRYRNGIRRSITRSRSPARSAARGRSLSKSVSRSRSLSRSRSRSYDRNARRW